MGGDELDGGAPACARLLPLATGSSSLPQLAVGGLQGAARSPPFDVGKSESAKRPCVDKVTSSLLPRGAGSFAIRSSILQRAKSFDASDLSRARLNAPGMAAPARCAAAEAF
jgi:hypothetical protein